MIIDEGTLFGSFPATNVSFILPFICFIIVTLYGFRIHYAREKAK